MPGFSRGSRTHRARAEARRAEREQRSAASKSPSSPPAEDALLKLEAQQRIATAVRNLPDPYRDVLLRHYYDGQSIEEIARATARVPSTIRSQLTRGRARLRSQLECDADSNKLRKADSLSALGLLELATGAPRAAGATTPIATSTGVWVALAAATATALATAWTLESRGEPDANVLATLEPVQDPHAKEVVPRDARRARQDVLGTHSSNHDAGGGGRTAVCALVVDPSGQPIAGAVLQLYPPTPEPDRSPVQATTDEQGIVTLYLADALLKPDADETSCAFSVRAPGYATKYAETRVPPDRVTELDDFQLAPGGALEGLVVHAGGQPAPGAVLLAAMTGEGAMGELLRFSGPPMHRMRTSAIAPRGRTLSLRRATTRRHPVFGCKRMDLSGR